MSRIKGLTNKGLKKSYKRLRRKTRMFSNLIVRDPVDYLDFEVNITENIKNLISEINRNEYRPRSPVTHLSAKSKGMNRPTVVFDIKDALVYRFCIEQIEDSLIKKTRLNKNIYGGVKITINKNPDGDDFYEKWFDNWLQFIEGVEESLERKKYLVNTDIASYFENISLQVLKDRLRSDINGKTHILNLLFFFLEHSVNRNEYEVNTHIGLPQEDIDCSRLLAYYFLHPHDDRMREFCKQNKAEFFRYVDDMNVAVDSEITAKKALKTISESLRKLNLVASIEKTTILSASKAKEELFFQENANLTLYQDTILLSLRLKDKRLILKQKRNLVWYYKKLKKKKNEFKNWHKILRRFYSLGTYIQSDFLMNDIVPHIIQYPSLLGNKRMSKYLIRNKSGKKFPQTIRNLIAYIYSGENLYPEVETQLLETLLLFSTDDFPIDIVKAIKKLGGDILYRKRKGVGLSDYARGLACLLIFRYNGDRAVETLAQHFIETQEDNNVLKKHMFFVAMTSKKEDTRDKAMNKAKMQDDISIHRLVSLIERINRYKTLAVVKEYISNKELFIIANSKKKHKISEKYRPVRSEVLKSIIEVSKPE